MNTAMLQEQVAEKVQLLYKISQDLETLFPGRHYTPDGHMIGSIGEALAASFYGLDLFTASEKHMTPRRRMADWYKSKQPKSSEFPCPVSRNGCSF